MLLLCTFRFDSEWFEAGSFRAVGRGRISNVRARSSSGWTKLCVIVAGAFSSVLERCSDLAPALRHVWEVLHATGEGSAKATAEARHGRIWVQVQSALSRQIFNCSGSSSLSL